MQASLEEAFMELTRDEVEYSRSNPARRRAWSWRHEQRSCRRCRPAARRAAGTRHAGAGRAVGVDEVRLAAFDALVARRRRVLTIALPGALRGGDRVALGAHVGAHDRAGRHPLDIALAGVNVAQLAIAVLGVLVITGEYSTGMIRSTLIAVPKRLPVLWAKTVVFAVVTFVLMVPAVLIAFFASQAILPQHHILQISFARPASPRSLDRRRALRDAGRRSSRSGSARSCATRQAGSQRSPGSSSSSRR